LYSITAVVATVAVFVKYTTETPLPHWERGSSSGLQDCCSGGTANFATEE
jgi:hypothetical protein